MRKNNWIVAIVVVIAAAILLGLWFVLGFSHVDAPLDPVLTLVWAVVLIAAIAAIVWAENKRREKMRTAFVGNGVLYSPEFGLVQTSGSSEVDALQRTLAAQEYPDEVAKLDKNNRPAFRWVVKSEKFDADQGVWSGKVFRAEDASGTAMSFANRDELAAIIA